MEAAEQSNNSIESLVDLIVCQLLKPLSELVIAKECDVVRSFGTIIHEILETKVSRLLEPHVITESFFNQIVHLGFELEKLESKLIWIFQVFLVFDNLGPLLQDVGVHLIDDVDQSGGSPIEHVIHHAQLVNLALCEHVLAPSIFLGKALSLEFNCLLKEDVNHLALGLLLQEIVSVVLLLLKME